MEEEDDDGDDVDATAENREDDAKEKDAQDDMVVFATTRGPRTRQKL